MVIKPRHTKVLIELDKTETKTESGILLATSAQSASLYATVIAIGPEVEDIKEGDRVLLDKFTTKVELGDDRIMVDEGEILAIISK